MCRSSLDGNREIPRLASCGAPLWPASGRRGAVADDERTWEVRLRNSSWEADEQSRATGCGVGGATVEIADLTAFLTSLTGTLPDDFVVTPVLPAASFIAQPG